MPGVEVLSHVAANNFFVGFEEIEISLTFFRCELEGNMEKLAQAQIEQRIALIWRRAPVN